MSMSRALFFLLIPMLTFSCVTTYEELLEKDIKEIEDYIEDKNLDAIQLDEGVFVVIEEEGSSEKPGLSNIVTVDYKGYYLEDEEEFDSSYSKGTPLEAPLTNLIQGWQIGMQEFGRGGSGIILIPSGLGYGALPPSGIRRDAILVFEIELIDFE